MTWKFRWVRSPRRPLLFVFAGVTFPAGAASAPAVFALCWTNESLVHLVVKVDSSTNQLDDQEAENVLSQRAVQVLRVLGIEYLNQVFGATG